VVAYTPAVKYLPPEVEDAETIITLAIYSFWVAKQVVKTYRAKKQNPVVKESAAHAHIQSSSSLT
jgi:hypothetical protein